MATSFITFLTNKKRPVSISSNSEKLHSTRCGSTGPCYRPRHYSQNSCKPYSDNGL